MTIVTHHAHHPDEGVYRLVHAEPVVEFHATEDEDGKTVVSERVIGHVHHRDVIWADDDERWHGKSREEIATEQRRDVQEALARDRAVEDHEPEVFHLGSVGQTL